jgi:hypothetical protein
VGHKERPGDQAFAARQPSKTLGGSALTKSLTNKKSWTMKFHFDRSADLGPLLLNN